ncbi:MAG: glycosyltransferase family 25 protein [Simkaniaceae bacterium]|nr:glycosyltransferase family 25 protein [Simkaniaceae bacterium]
MRILLTTLFTTFAFCGVFNVTKTFNLDHKMFKFGPVETVYMINLDQRPEKWARSTDQLRRYKLRPYRFSAVNGWELSINEINQTALKLQKGMVKNIFGTQYSHRRGEILPKHLKIKTIGNPYFSHCMSRGAIGCVLSHLSVIKHAYDAKQELIWVMEDDISVKQSPKKMLDAIRELNKTFGRYQWDFLYTDSDTVNNNGKKVPLFGYNVERPDYKPSDIKRFYRRSNISSTIEKIGARFGTYSYLITRQGMKKVIDFYTKHQIFFPYDIELSLPDSINMYVMKEDVITHMQNSPSDNGAPYYRKKN